MGLEQGPGPGEELTEKQQKIEESRVQDPEKARRMAKAENVMHQGAAEFRRAASGLRELAQTIQPVGGQENPIVAQLISLAEGYEKSGELSDKKYADYVAETAAGVYDREKESE